MPFLSIFSRKDKPKSSNARPRPSTDIQDDYVLPPIPTSSDSWSDPTPTLRLVPSQPPASSLSNLPTLAYSISNTSSANPPTLPPIKNNKLSKQTPSNEQNSVTATPRPKRPSFFAWSSAKSKSKSFQHESHPAKPSFESHDSQSFNLKSFRHVAPPPAPFPTKLQATSATLLQMNNGPSRTIKPNTGFQVTSRPRGDSTHSLAESTSSQTVTVSAFKQAARRSTSNLDISAVDDAYDLPLPPPISISERPSITPLRSNTPPSSFRNSSDSVRDSTPHKSAQNSTPLQSITGATRRYSGALASGSDTDHTRQTPVQPQHSSLQKASNPLASNSNILSNGCDSKNTLRSSGISKARSALGYFTTPASPSDADPTGGDDPASLLSPRESFYRRQRASLSTGALPGFASPARRSPAIATNAGIISMLIIVLISDLTANPTLSFQIKANKFNNHMRILILLTKTMFRKVRMTIRL